MFSETVRELKTAFLLVVMLTILTGMIYPYLVFEITQRFFPWQANGSLIEQNGRVMGSVFIGQPFVSPAYFWGRPSATQPYSYNGMASAGSNFGPSNPDFINLVNNRVRQIKQYTADSKLVPVDLVTASASGLDPEISPLAAFYQAPRIAKARHMTENEIQRLIAAHIIRRTYYLLGEPRVNVLQLNLALDNLRNSHGRATP